MSRLLVTGASGMLGSYVVTCALDRGWRVRALARDPFRTPVPHADKIEVVVGDLCSAASLRRAIQDCDAVVHTAAVIGSGGPSGQFHSGNVVGTENLLDAVRWAGARLVHVSSTAVVGAARYRSHPTDETVPLPELPTWDAYGRSKQAAERRVLRHVDRGRLWATVVRPPVMYGRRDRQFVPRLAPFLRRGLAPLPAGGRTTLPLVHAASVAQGTLLALSCDQARGRVYHLTEDRPVTVADLWSGAALGLDTRIRLVPLPRGLAAAGFAALAATLWVLGRGDLARHAGGTYRMLTRPNPFTAERARRELGWRPCLDPVDALAEAFRWWADHSPEASS